MQIIHLSGSFKDVQLMLPEVEGPLYIDVSVLSLLSLPTLLLRTDTPSFSAGASRPSEAWLCSASMGQHHLKEGCFRQGLLLVQCLWGNSVPFHPRTASVALGAYHRISIIIGQPSVTKAALCQTPHFSHLLLPCAAR